eukprot:4861199-Amphidinium_carterae.2
MYHCHIKVRQRNSTIQHESNASCAISFLYRSGTQVRRVIGDSPDHCPHASCSDALATLPRRPTLGSLGAQASDIHYIVYTRNSHRGTNGKKSETSEVSNRHPIPSLTAQFLLSASAL